MEIQEIKEKLTDEEWGIILDYLEKEMERQVKKHLKIKLDEFMGDLFYE